MSLYKQDGSDIWWMRFTLKGYPRVRRTTGETDRAKAQREEDKSKAALWLTAPALTGKTWGNAALKWVDHKPRADAELRSLLHFGKFFADCRLTDITPTLVDKALKKFCKTPQTYTRHRARVSAILRLSGVDVKLETRKAGKVKERDWLTHEQWGALELELPDHLLHMARFSIATGLRQANVLSLRWANVDLARKLVWVDATDAKGGKAIPVPLSLGAINALSSVQDAHPEFCFTYKGAPFAEVNKAWKRANTRAGTGRLVEEVDVDTGKVKTHYTGFTWHGLRHTWATWHVQNGTPLDVLQKLGGWASYSMVLRYAHHAPSYLAGFADNTTKKLHEINYSQCLPLTSRLHPVHRQT